ncbi:MAG: hypothetical protein AAGA30_02930 [Planctomycetota bacterium]
MFVDLSTVFSMNDSLIFLFIISYLLMAWCWNLPDDSSSKVFIKQFRKLIVWAGLWHSWSMFAPNPVSVERRFTLEVFEKSGQKHDIDLPTLRNLNAWQGFKRVRERKFQMNLASKKFSSFRIAICHYHIKIFEIETGKEVVKANLVMLTKKVPSPGSTKEPAEKSTVLCALEK